MIAYIIEKERLTAFEALKRIQLIYSKADPNLDFLIQLEEFHQQIAAKVRLDDQQQQQQQLQSQQQSEAPRPLLAATSQDAESLAVEPNFSAGDRDSMESERDSLDSAPTHSYHSLPQEQPQSLISPSRLAANAANSGLGGKIMDFQDIIIVQQQQQHQQQQDGFSLAAFQQSAAQEPETNLATCKTNHPQLIEI